MHILPTIVPGAIHTIPTIIPIIIIPIIIPIIIAIIICAYAAAEGNGPRKTVHFFGVIFNANNNEQLMLFSKKVGS